MQSDTAWGRTSILSKMLYAMYKKVVTSEKQMSFIPVHVVYKLRLKAAWLTWSAERQVVVGIDLAICCLLVNFLLLSLSLSLSVRVLKNF